MTTQDRQAQLGSQSKLVNRIMEACGTATALTTLEVIGALELAKGELTMRMIMTRTAGTPATPESIIHPN